MNQSPFVSVIIPTYHDWDCLKQCLNALKAQSYPAYRFEVLVVNNDPDDLSPYGVVKGNVRLLEESKPGSYAARNAAIRVAKGEIFAFTDSDCIPDADWLLNAVTRLMKGAHRIAGHVDLFFRSEKLTFVEIFEKAFAFDQESNARSGASVTANMITWRKNFDDVGLFNEELMSGGDFEWGWKASAAGIPIAYSQNVIVRHPARFNFRQIFRKNRRIIGGQENMKFLPVRRNVLRLLVLGYLPPVRACIKIARKTDMRAKEKLAVIGILWILESYKTSYRLGFRAGLFQPKRA